MTSLGGSIVSRYTEFDRVRPVRQYRRDGTFVAEYASLQAMFDRPGFKMSVPYIQRCCERKARTSQAYIWRFADDDEFAKSEIKPPVVEVVKQAEPIVGTSKAKVEFCTPLRRVSEYHLIAGENGRYHLIELETGRYEDMNAVTMFWQMCYGDLISECYFHDNGLAFDESEDLQSFVLPLEVWREFRVGDRHYEVSNLGHVCIKGYKTLVPISERNIDGKRCMIVELQDGNGGVVTRSVAGLVAEAFVVDLNKKVEITHRDGNPANCSFANLSCCPDPADTKKFPVKPIGEDDLREVTEYKLNGIPSGYYASIVEAAVHNGRPVEEIRDNCERRSVSNFVSLYRYDDDDEFYDMEVDERSKVFGKFVRQYGLDGKFIKEHMDVDADVKACCEGTPGYEFVHDSVWRYFKDDGVFPKKLEECIALMPQKGIRQYSSDGELLHAYSTIKDAGKAVGVSANLISMVCRPNCMDKIANSVWRFIDDDELVFMSESERESLFGHDIIHIYKSSGVYMAECSSLEEAAKFSGLFKADVMECLSTKLALNGWAFRYLKSDDLAELSESARSKKLGYRSRKPSPVDENQLAIAGVVPEQVEVNKGKITERWCAASIHNVRYPNGTYKYEVSNLGRVRVRSNPNKESYQILAQQQSQTSSFLFVTLTDASHNSRRVSVGRLVASAFCVRPAGCNSILYKNDNLQDNRAKNLKWCREEEIEVHRLGH